MCTRPLLLVPALLELCFFWGVLVVGIITTGITAIALSKQPGPFQDLMSVFSYLVQLPASAAETPPAALQSEASIASTIHAALSSPQAWILAGIILLFVLLLTVLVSYTHALTLAVLKDAHENRRTAFFDMFRQGRAYFIPVLRYCVPFAILGGIALVMIVPIALTIIASYVMNGQPSLNLPLPAIVLILMLGLVFLLRVLTIFADGEIVHGSRRPIKSSLKYLANEPAQSVLVAVILTVLAVVVFLLNQGIESLRQFGGVGLSIVVSVVGALLFIVWRLWVSAYVIALWKGTVSSPAPPSK